MSSSSGSEEEEASRFKIAKYAAVHVNFSVNTEGTNASLRNAWIKEEDFSGTDVQIWSTPFRSCEVLNFLYDDDFVQDLVTSLEDITLEDKVTDLFKFKQSEDLSGIDHPEVQTLMTFLKGPCRDWIQKITGFALTDKVHATFSEYACRDYLLCHDDKCEDRKVAFILYCNEAWDEDNGGALELYSSDRNDQPSEVARNIYPLYNKFVFFEVSDKSYHRVSEVLTSQQSRITVNGWFHAEDHLAPSSPFVDDLPVEVPIIEIPYLQFEVVVQPQYLRGRLLHFVKDNFEVDSQILLQEFLNVNVIEGATNELVNANNWKNIGPANRRNYKILDGFENLQEVQKIVRTFRSFCMLELLMVVSGLELINPDDPVSPKCSIEVARWSRGSYTLLTDPSRMEEFKLEVILFLNAPVNEERLGGKIKYTDTEDGEELLTVEPVNNALAMIYRDDKTSRFVEYLSLLNPAEDYYTITVIYKETI